MRHSPLPMGSLCYFGSIRLFFEYFWLVMSVNASCHKIHFMNGCCIFNTICNYISGIRVIVIIGMGIYVPIYQPTLKLGFTNEKLFITHLLRKTIMIDVNKRSEIKADKKSFFIHFTITSRVFRPTIIWMYSPEFDPGFTNENSFK